MSPANRLVVEESGEVKHKILIRLDLEIEIKSMGHVCGTGGFDLRNVVALCGSSAAVQSSLVVIK